MNEEDIMKKFVARLMSNPCFAKETPFKIEEQIRLFFETNQQGLKPTFSSENYFPHLSWEESGQLFYKTLREMTNTAVQPMLQALAMNQLDYSFVEVLSSRKRLKDDYGAQLLTFLNEMMNMDAVRINMDTVLNAISHRLPDKYISEIFFKRSYTIFEIEKVQKLNLNAAQTTEFIKIALLIHLVGYASKLEKSNVKQKGKNSLLFLTRRQTENLFHQYKSKLSLFPEALIQSGIKTNMSFAEDEMLEATSRVSRIIYELGKSYRPDIKVSRGAETFEKSWFQIQKKNYGYFGFDKKMVDEFYRISAENYW